MSFKLLAKSKNNCVVTNTACYNTKVPPRNVASKLSSQMSIIRGDDRASDRVKKIDPSGEFSVSMLNSCRKGFESYPGGIQTFCGLRPYVPYYQADYQYAGTAVDKLAPGTYDALTLFTSFFDLIFYMHQMHSVHKVGNYDVTPSNVFYDSHTNKLRIVDWKSMGEIPSRMELGKKITYPPEAGFIRGNFEFPISETVVQKWLHNYEDVVTRSISNSPDVCAEVIARNVPKFIEFISNPDNARVFTYYNRDLWSGPNLERFDSFGLGLVGGYLYSNSASFPSIEFKNHIITLIAGLLSSVPCKLILNRALLYLAWILDFCSHKPKLVRNPIFDACFPVLETAPIPAGIFVGGTHVLGTMPAAKTEDEEHVYDSDSLRPRDAHATDKTESQVHKERIRQELERIYAQPFAREGGRKSRRARRSVLSKKRRGSSKRKLTKRRRSSSKRKLSKRRR
jgi:hypothetical protein